jgi:murein DD-endopeptidase MepM/ murein hydrolase activator NlpD
VDLPSSLFERIKGIRRNHLTWAVVGIGAVAFGAFFVKSGLSNQLSTSLLTAHAPAELGAFQVKIPTMRYGFAIDTFLVTDNTIRSGQSLSDILATHHIDYPIVDKLASNARGVFDIKQLKAGNSYTVLSKDSDQSADYFIYEPNVFEYIVFHLKDDLKVERVKREVTTTTQTAAGILESSLWKTMTDNGFSAELTDKMEDALQWSLDFHHLQKGDEFKLVYDEHNVEGKPVGVSKVKAAYYKTGEKVYHAIYYENGEYKGYYDLKGQPMKTSFLRAPLKYSRISSHFNLSRLHPILKYRRPHYGTDYAAPYGTPILAVGDGTISQAAFTSGNGNFVRIRHDGAYETQYLHMQRFAKGIRPGVRVQQGQVIGYVGSTGLATGPHVCFRFWKNGQQVNHLRLNFPPAKPLPAGEMPAFEVLRDGYLAKLNGEEQSNP